MIQIEWTTVTVLLGYETICDLRFQISLHGDMTQVSSLPGFRGQSFSEPDLLDCSAWSNTCVYLLCHCIHVTYDLLLSVSGMLHFSHRVRHLASVQSWTLVRVAHAHYLTGRIRGRVGRVMPSKVVWSNITLLQQEQLYVCWLTGVYMFYYKCIKL